MKETGVTGSVLEELIRDFRERPLPSYTPRDAALLKQAGKADVLVGMRRSGKTWRLFQEMAQLEGEGVSRDRVLYLNFEDDRLEPLGSGVLSLALETFYRMNPAARTVGAWIFLDEVQRVPGWSRVARRILDTEEARLVVTGSSARLLSREVATEFRGRGFPVEILPFSFREAVRHAGKEAPSKAPGARMRSWLEASFDRYLMIGGFPEVQEVEERARVRILQDYVEIVLLRDIVERHSIANVPAVRALALAALHSTGSALSVHKAYRDFRSRGMEVSKDLVYAALDHFEDACLIFRVPVFRKSIRSRQQTPRKVYAIDPGLARAVSHVTARDRGARLETVVYLELRRRRGGAREGEISFYRTSAGHEVDFVLGSPEEEHAAELVQVSAEMADPRTRERELRALGEAMGETGLETAIVVTLREDGTEELPEGTVRLVPAWRWLLGL